MNYIKGSKKGKTIGIFPKDNYKSPFVEAWKSAVKKESFDTVSKIYDVMIVSINIKKSLIYYNGIITPYNKSV